MAFDDLRSFLHALDQQGQLLKISEEVNAEPDLAAAANATGRIGDGAPALWFDNIRGFTDARVAMNTIGSWQNHAISLGLPPNTPVKKQIDEFIRRWDNFPVAPERRANPGWAENTVDGDAINLFDILPLFRLNDGDGGFYLDKACVVSRDPLDPDNFGKQNVGIYRMEVKGKRKLGLQPVPMHDIALHLHKAEERGEDLPIAITLGNDPIITLMGATPLKYDQSEYEMAGALRESPYPIATAPLTGFDVPWGSEVILEGVIESRKREIEGPFGEFTGHYSGGRNMTVVRIDKVSYHSKPIFESLYLGMPWTEIDYLMGPATCVPLYQQLKAEFPEDGGQFLPPDAGYSQSCDGEKRHLHAVRDAQNRLLLRLLTVVNTQSHQGKAESRPTHAVWPLAITALLQPGRYHWVPLHSRLFRQKPLLRSHQIPRLHLNHELSAYSDS